MVQPTGSGKSLCFQLPPLISGGLSVVITLTISLMQDQAVGLQEKSIKVTFLGSTQKDPTVSDQLRQGAIDLVFVTVDRLSIDSLQEGEWILFSQSWHLKAR